MAHFKIKKINIKLSYVAWHMLRRKVKWMLRTCRVSFVCHALNFRLTWSSSKENTNSLQWNFSNENILVFCNDIQNGISSVNQNKAAPLTSPCIRPTFRGADTEMHNPVVLSSKQGTPTTQWVPNRFLCSISKTVFWRLWFYFNRE